MGKVKKEFKKVRIQTADATTGEVESTEVIDVPMDPDYHFDKDLGRWVKTIAQFPVLSSSSSSSLDSEEMERRAALPPLTLDEVKELNDKFITEVISKTLDGWDLVAFN